MGRNPKAEALRRATNVQREWEAHRALTAKLSRARKVAMLACVDAGCTHYEVGDLFKVSPQLVGNTVKALREEG